MVAAPNPVQLVRLSPSGPEMGQPGALIGGGNSVVPGRLWTAQGVGAALVSTPYPADDVPGLVAVAVDMKAGYKYDCEVDAQFFGDSGHVVIILLGSSDGGATYSAIETTVAHFVNNTNSARLHKTNVVGPYDHLKVQVTAGDDTTCQYLPQLTALKVREYSASS